MPATTVEVTRRYSLLHKLGEGGMGEVYAALDRLTGSMVALKRVLLQPKDLVFNSYVVQTDEAQMRRILANEFRVLASLRHPHIISVLDYGFDSERYPYYTMSLLDEPRTVLQASASFTLPERIRAFAQMLQALAYLHRRGILHRDLKPGNVLIDDTSAVKLLDFGLATQENVRDGTTGTLAYMPPEMIRQRPATPQSDLYSIGMVAYELFVGQYPFSGEKHSELIEQLLNEMPEMELIPDVVRPIIFRLLMKDPADRYPDAEAALADLAAMTDGAVAVEDATVRESFLQAARFIGRETELDMLTDRLDQIVEETRSSIPFDSPVRGAAYLIGGESGVGKSRLLEELRIHALLTGALVLRGQCVAESGQPFQMWRDVVRRLLLEDDISDLDASIFQEIIPDIGDLLGRSVAPAPPLAAINAQNRLVEAILDLFQRQTQPILLVLEDLHWGMENLIPLRRLIDIGKSLPLLIVGSYRNDEMPILPTQLPGARVIHLGRLTAEEVAALSRAMIGSAGEQNYLIEYLHQQSEGNVLFLVEVIRALAESAGSLREIGAKTLPEHVFAGGIDRIVARRLEHLPAEAAPALQLAAVAGRNIDETLLRWLIGADAERWLQAGLNAAILEVMGARWRFAHDRLREAVISMIPPADLPTCHQRIAEGLEAVYPGQPDLALVLYEHWRAAGNHEKAMLYAVQVMEQRMYLGILNEANQMLEKALALKPEDPNLQLRLYVLAGEIYYDLGKPQASGEAYAEGLKLARRLKQPHEIGLALEGLGNAAQAISDYDTAISWYEQSLNHRRAVQDWRGVASALHMMSVFYRFRGNYDESWQALQESARLRREYDLRGLGDSFYQMSVHARNRGDYAEAIDYLQQGIELRRTMADGRGIGDDLNMLGICLTLVGDYDQARSTLRDSLARREVIDNQRGVASCLNAIGELGLAQSNYAEAIHRFSVSLGIWQGKLDRWNIANSFASLGCAQARAKELLSARHNLYEGLVTANAIPALFIVLKALIGWAQIKIGDGDSLGAALLLGAIDSHHSMTAQLRQIYYAPVLAALDTNAYGDEFEAGRNLDIQSLVQTLLIEAKADF